MVKKTYFQESENIPNSKQGINIREKLHEANLADFIISHFFVRQL